VPRDCGPENGHGPEDARGALAAIGKILEVGIRLYGIEDGTRH
jgi:hypothetical protein